MSTQPRDFGFLGITIKDVVSFLLLVVSATMFVTNMNNRIDNLTAAVDRLNVNIEKKDATDVVQNRKIETLEKNIIIIDQILKISTIP